MCCASLDSEMTLNSEIKLNKESKRMRSGPDCTLVSVRGAGEVIHTNDPDQISVAWV